MDIRITNDTEFEAFAYKVSECNELDRMMAAIIYGFAQAVKVMPLFDPEKSGKAS